jgi:hypothetical protein
METTEKFIILDIRGLEDSKSGEVALVTANPVMVLPSGRHVYTPYENDESEKFMIPLFMIDECVQCAEEEKLWEPDLGTFVKSNVRFETGIKSIYRHISLY